IPVSIFVAVIVTPGMSAPVTSETEPPSVAFAVCPNADPTIRRHNTAAARKSLFTVHLPLGLGPLCTKVTFVRIWLWARSVTARFPARFDILCPAGKARGHRPPHSGQSQFGRTIVQPVI